MLKTVKIPTIAPTCFGSHRTHHQGTISCLAKTTIMILLCSPLITWSMLWQHTSLLCKRAVHGRGRNWTFKTSGIWFCIDWYQLLFTDTESYCRSLESAQEFHTSNLTHIAYAWESSQYHKFNYHINWEIGVMYYNTHVTKFSDTVRAQCFVLTPNTKSMFFHFILDL